MADHLSLTDLQIDIMRVLWQLGEGTVAQVYQALADRDLAQPTVATLLMRLEKKGALAHRVEGRQFVYRAVLSEGDVRRSVLTRIADHLFGGDVPQLMHHLLSSREISRGDLDQVKELIAQRERLLAARGRTGTKTGGRKGGARER